MRGDSRSLVFDVERPHPGDHASLRRAHLRRGRRCRPRHHRQGRAARAAGRPDRLRDPRPRLRRLPDGAGGTPGRPEPGRVRAASGRDAHRDQVPADRRAPLRGDRPPRGRDRGQGLGGAGAAGRASPTGSSTWWPPAGRSRRTASRSARRSPTSTARLVANRVSHKLRAAEVDDLVERLRPERG